MSKKERVFCSLRSEAVDRPPFSFWYHFGLQHGPGSAHAEAQISFFEAYDLDFLKVMNDYPYPMPSGLEVLADEEDWKKVEPLNSSDQSWREQLTALSIINDAIGNEAPFIDTIFSPWTIARRLAGSNGLIHPRSRFPETLLSAMDNIAATLASYAAAAVGRGASGIFLSVSAATDDVMSPEDYAVWCRPFDLKVLSAVQLAPFNVLHIHGKNIHFDSLLDYPVSALNWSHHRTAPSLAEGRTRWRKPVLGGIDETAVSHMSVLEIRRQVTEAVSTTWNSGLLVAPGCSVPTDTPTRNLRAVKEALTGTRY